MLWLEKTGCLPWRISNSSHISPFNLPSFHRCCGFFFRGRVKPDPGPLLGISIHGCHLLKVLKFYGCQATVLQGFRKKSRVPLHRSSKFCGCQAPVAPVLTRALFNNLCGLHWRTYGMYFDTSSSGTFLGEFNSTLLT